MEGKEATRRDAAIEDEGEKDPGGNTSLHGYALETKADLRKSCLPDLLAFLQNIQTHIQTNTHILRGLYFSPLCGGA